MSRRVGMGPAILVGAPGPVNASGGYLQYVSNTFTSSEEISGASRPSI
jgi:hypothetical protein